MLLVVLLSQRLALVALSDMLQIGGRARAKRQERLPGAIPFLSRYFLGDIVRFVCTNKTHEPPGQTPAQHLLNIYLYIMNIPMHQQWQTQLCISNEIPSHANTFAHAHQGRRA